MQVWHDFYFLLGGVAATLIGLLFVAVSLNADAILGPTHRHSKRLAEQAFQNYMCVLIISLLVSFPRFDVIDLAYSILWTTGFWGLWVLFRIYQTLILAPVGENRVRSLRRYLPSFLGFGTLIYAGAHMLRHEDESVLAGIGVVVLLISATMLSWELLIRVAEEKYAAHKD